MNEIASRYAVALFTIAEEENKILDIQLEVEQINQIFNENGEFVDVLNSAFLTREEKIKTLEKVLVGVNENIVSLLKVVVNNNRASYIPVIFEAFNTLCNDSRGILEGIIYSTEKLDSKVIDRISAKISKLENRTVKLKNKIDPSLIGGVKVVVHDRIYDGSIKNQLSQMKENLLTKEESQHEN